MKTVTANMLTYDAEVGRLEPGQDYYIEDAKAERWIQSGIASEASSRRRPDPEPEPEPEPQPAPPTPAPQPEEEGEEEGDDKDEDEPDEARAAEARKLHEGGASQRQIAEEMGISRASVRRLLAG
jgi:helix-turn-helix resolvase-like protein